MKDKCIGQAKSNLFSFFIGHYSLWVAYLPSVKSMPMP